MSILLPCIKETLSDWYCLQSCYGARLILPVNFNFSGGVPHACPSHLRTSISTCTCKLQACYLCNMEINSSAVLSVKLRLLWGSEESKGVTT